MCVSTYDVNVMKISMSSKTIAFDKSFDGHCTVEAENVQDALRRAIDYVSAAKHVPAHHLWATPSEAKKTCIAKKDIYPGTCEVFSIDRLAHEVCPANICRNARLLNDATLSFEVFDGDKWNKTIMPKHEYQARLGMDFVVAFFTEHEQMCVMSKA